MRIFEDINPLQAFLRSKKANQENIGFVPTMGALHQGHISLINASKVENDITICSIYVNPEQFSNPTDLVKYPRLLQEDIKMLEAASCDVLFCPSDKVMYPERPKLKIDFGFLETTMEGKFRQGHFTGVAIIVSKLFHIVNPDRVYFGQKDLQQFLIVKQINNELSFNLQLQCVPIVREQDGLAMSSRNSRLDKKERLTAAQLYQSLTIGKQNLLVTENVFDTKNKMAHYLSAFNDIRVEYIEIVDAADLNVVNDITQHEQVALCIAAYVGNVRLIDNILLFNID